jgi:hypothetical protein
MPTARPRHHLLPVAIVLALLAMLLPAPAPTAPAAAQTMPDAPYLIYWEGNHLRIERADGANSFTVGEGYFPPTVDTLRGFAFSPSGEWLFVEATPQFLEMEATLPANTLLLVNLYTGETFPLPPQPVMLADYAWHPTEDILVLQTITAANPEGPPPFTPADERELVTIDPDAGTFIALWRFTPEYTPAIPLRTELGFIDRLAYAIFSYENPQGGLEDRRVRRVVFDSEALLIDDTFAATTLEVAGDTTFARIEQDAIVFEDLSSTQSGQPGPTYRFERNPEFSIHFELTPDGRGALVDDAGRFSWLDLSPLGSDPTAVQPLEIATNSLRSTFDDTYFPPGDRVIGNTWSDSGHFRVFYDLNTSGPWVFDRRDQSRTDLPADVGGQAMGWQGDTVLFVDGNPDDNTHILTAYDAASGAFAQATSTFRQTGTVPALTADAAHVFVNQFGVRVVDLVAADVDVRSTDSRSYFTGQFGAAFAHPTQPYVLLQTDALLAGGGSIRWLSVQSVDGSVQREIITEGPVIANFDRPAIAWLPPQVDPARLLPGEDRTNDFSARIARYTTGHWNFDLTWNADGTALAAGLTPHNIQPISVIDLTLNTDVGASTPVNLDPDASVYEIELVFNSTEVASEQRPFVQESPTSRPVWMDLETNNTGTDLLLFGGERFQTGARVIAYTAPDFARDAAVVWEFPEKTLFGGTGDISPSGIYAAYGGTVVDLVVPEIVARLPYGDVQAMAFSPDGSLLAVSAGYTVDIWAVDDLIPPRG